MRKIVSVKELGEIITGNTPPRNDPDFYGDYKPFIKATDISESSKYTYKPEEYYSEKAYKKYIRSLIPKGSTCVVTIGSVGKKMTMAHCDLFINQAMNAIVPNQNFDSEYVYYVMKNNIHKLKKLDSGTASGRENVSKSAFSNMEIEIDDDITKQKKIGRSLSAYDNLIENNQKQIKLLEEAAQRLYKQWFIDLRFPGHETTPIVDGLPEGWRKESVKDCLEMHIGGGWGKDNPDGKNTFAGKVIRGTDINDVKQGNFNDVPTRYHTANDMQKRKLAEYDIVFELSNGNINNIGRSLFVNQLLLENCGENTICASFCKLLRSKNKYLAMLLYLEIQDMQNSGRMLPYKKHGSNGINNFDFEGFLKHEFLIPSNKNILAPFFDIMKKIANIQKSFSLLIESRDRLLPKLMNGELEV